MERITVALIARASGELQELCERTGLSKTDITNRAISMYAFVDGELSAGRELVVRDPESGKEQVVRFF